MSKQDSVKSRLLSLAERACQRLGNAQVLGLVSLDNQQNRHIVHVKTQDREATIRVDDDFLESSEDETMISFLTTAIKYDF